MLKIPKQIYFDQETLNLYSAYAQAEHKPFAAVIREILAEKAPMIKNRLAKTAAKSSSFLDLYGSVKSPYKKAYSWKYIEKKTREAVARDIAAEGL